MNESPSQHEEKRSPDQAQSFGFDDLSEVGKAVVEYYRENDELPLPAYRVNAIGDWLKHVTPQEHAFLLDEARKMQERIYGGNVLRALVLTNEEYDKYWADYNQAKFGPVVKPPPPKPKAPKPTPPRTSADIIKDLKKGIDAAHADHNHALAYSLLRRLHEEQNRQQAAAAANKSMDLLGGMVKDVSAQGILKGMY